jgi:hypothetical protein
MTSLQEKCGKCGYTRRVEAMVSVMPVSLVSSLKGFQSGKILRKSMHLMMLKGTLTQLSE